jgi:Cdc6-like AAA superfamily ATPase
MITLLDIIELCKKEFPEQQEINLSLLLYCWIKNPDEYLKQLFDQKTRLRLLKNLKPLIKSPVKTKSETLQGLLSIAGGKEVLGRHILLKISSDLNNDATQAFILSGIDMDTLKKEISHKNKEESKPVHVTNGSSKIKSIELSSYFTDISEKAKNGDFDHYYAINEYLSLMVKVLSRRDKPNILIHGDAGTGKTSLVGLLARSIQQGKTTLPSDLKIIGLSINSLISNTKYRGDLEKRLESLSAFKNSNAILFIDELHMIYNLRAEDDATSIANVLKPMLTEGLRIIGATTTHEYNKYFSNDSATIRRFEPISIPEPTGEVLTQIVNKQMQSLSKFHCVKEMPKEMVAMSIQLSDNFLPGHQPDKAVSMIDTVMASVRSEGRKNVEIIDIHKYISDSVPPAVSIIFKQKQSLKNGQLQSQTEILSENFLYQYELQSMIDVIAENLNGKTNIKSLGQFLFYGQLTGAYMDLLGSTISKILFKQKEYFTIDLSNPYSEISRPEINDTELVQLLRDKGGGVILLKNIRDTQDGVSKRLADILECGFIKGSQENLPLRHCVFLFAGSCQTEKKIQGFVPSSRNHIGFPLSRSFPANVFDECIEVSEQQNRIVIKQIVKNAIKQTIDNFSSDAPAPFSADVNKLTDQLYPDVILFETTSAISLYVKKKIKRFFRNDYQGCGKDLESIFNHRFYASGSIKQENSIRTVKALSAR